MKQARHTPEQIIGELHEAESIMAGGRTITHAVKQLGVGEQPFHPWRNQYGGMISGEAGRLNELDTEHGRWKKLVAEKKPDIAILKEAIDYLG